MHPAIEQQLPHLPDAPGVYLMLGAKGEVLYVGKAKSLRSRLLSHFRATSPTVRHRHLMEQVCDLRLNITRTEAEALLLEHTLIKAEMPRFNVLLRDDKTYPCIAITTQHTFPRITLHRGPRRPGNRYFGPYPSAGAARSTLKELGRLFGLRACRDTVFAHRTRPCLEYQIGRCSAPCVGLVEAQRYRQDVHHAALFLQGATTEVIHAMAARMDEAALAMDFEQAAALRDQIARLRTVQNRQYMRLPQGHLDVIAIAPAEAGHLACVAAVKDGSYLGSEIFTPRLPQDGPELDEAALRTTLLGQLYLERPVPPVIILDGPVDDAKNLVAMLRSRTGAPVRLTTRPRGVEARHLELARANLASTLALRSASSSEARRLAALGEALGLTKPPQRIECFDVSHTMGASTVASCVVLGPDGFIKPAYRRFNIRNAAPGDDYAAMGEVIRRRYARLLQEEGPLPDVVIVDGGSGQLAQAQAALQQLGLDTLPLLGIAKGPGRKVGLETLYRHGEPLPLAGDSTAMQLLQTIRDEAHRFAIGAHRRRRAKAQRSTTMQTIPGIGPKRSNLLLRQFGGLRGLSRAGLEDLAAIPGISHRIAAAVYHHFHPGTMP